MSWLRTDSIAGVSAEIFDALRAANDGLAMPYGDDNWSARLDTRFSALLGRSARVFPVTSGTAANALALAAVAGPYDLIAGHVDAHAFASECGATEMMSGGARFLHVPGEQGRIDPALLDAALMQAARNAAKAHRPAVLTVTQLTERGSVYPLDRLSALGEIARRHRLHVHMDGARFANAVVALGVSPAEMVAALGVDVLAFGATKNGTMGADAVVILNPDLGEQMARQRKRAGQDLSKARFLAAQLLAYLDADLWLRNARHANAMARRLADAARGVQGINVTNEVDGNIVFAAMTPEVVRALERADLAPRPHRTSGDVCTTFRLVTSFATTADEIERFEKAVGRLGHSH